jgi:pimeloyl-ACP methyl ester carboxylesterase
MSQKVLFIHGMGEHGPDWLARYTAILKTIHPNCEFADLSYSDIVNDFPLTTLTNNPPPESTDPRETYRLGGSDAFAEAITVDLLGAPDLEDQAFVQSNVGNTARTLMKLYKYVFRYLLGTSVGTAIWNTIRSQALQHLDKFGAEEGSVILMGHSLGSVIALDLVRDTALSDYWRKLISLGSPLGVIKHYLPALLRPANCSVRTPWIDVAAPDDIVAKIPVSRPKFSGNPLGTVTIKAGYPDPHGAYFFEKEAVDAWADHLL